MSQIAGWDTVAAAVDGFCCAKTLGVLYSSRIHWQCRLWGNHRVRKITDEEIAFFDENGFVICRDVLHQGELENVRAETQRLIDRVLEGGTREDEMCGRGPEGVPYYLTYLHSQPNDFSLRLLAHPFVGDLLHRMVGPDFVPCYEALVFKTPGNGSSVPWHRDGNPVEGNERVFNIDIYPDASTIENSCVWCVPGSHRWDVPQATEWVRKGQEDFEAPQAIGAVPAELEAGDVLLHHVKVLHGSDSNRSDQLRRVIYFDNRAWSWNEKYRWFGDEVMEKRARLYQHALHVRRENAYDEDDQQMEYQPPAKFPTWNAGDAIDLESPRDA